MRFNDYNGSKLVLGGGFQQQINRSWRKVTWN